MIVPKMMDSIDNWLMEGTLAIEEVFQFRKVKMHDELWWRASSGGGGPCQKGFSAKRSPHLNVGYQWWW